MELDPYILLGPGPKAFYMVIFQVSLELENSKFCQRVFTSWTIDTWLARLYIFLVRDQSYQIKQEMENKPIGDSWSL